MNAVEVLNRAEQPQSGPEGQKTVEPGYHPVLDVAVYMLQDSEAPLLIP